LVVLKRPLREIERGVSPDDGGSCHLWLGRGVPPAVNRRR
ncbi:MAG: head-tail joining protein, partial [Pirellulaceae bacterium]